ncbi:4-hydroxybenzoate 3-monooxygenase [Shimazuella sp. AN120528]|uniref:4-hydroxybenzoate 3-monooxygenase n=1 Tax=Shimazuella soli TaxID=1892854 RepID=UPI001F106A47|nr:4-hydroxybenzoate 3-monooxygenase [Shimazuella soli]MCH5586639.1 4-hydroxybenzoate 3-monooxygenase [Shimazuella soli]
MIASLPFHTEDGEHNHIDVKRTSTKVTILGAGPAGLVLGLLLQKEGIDCIIVERQSRDYVESRARAGFIEHHIVKFMRKNGFSDGLDNKGVPHTICEFRHNGHSYEIPYGEVASGSHWVYPQQFVVQDFIQLFISRGGQILFSHPAVELKGLESSRPVVTCSSPISTNTLLEIECDYIAGCDGFHGISRSSIPQNKAKIFSKQYGIGWLAILAEVPSTMERIVYALHESGFAGQMPRTSEITRFYLECPPNDTASNWSDDRVWEELNKRLSIEGDENLVRGPLIEKRVLNMRSVVMEPMQFGKLFLAGDAAHIITPVGAKGMNLAIADSDALAKAIIHYYHNRDETLLNQYSTMRLPHIWKTQEFSDWMIRLIHNTVDSNENKYLAFSDRLRQARLERLQKNGSYATLFAEDYVGYFKP